MKKKSKFLAGILALTMIFTSSLSASAAWEEDERDNTQWVCDAWPADDLFNLPATPEWAFIVASRFPTLEKYKTYLSENGYDFNDKEVIILFEDYQKRWINVSSMKPVIFCAPKFILTMADNIEMPPEKLGSVSKIAEFKEISDSYEILFTTYDDMLKAYNYLINLTNSNKHMVSDICFDAMVADIALEIDVTGFVNTDALTVSVDQTLPVYPEELPAYADDCNYSTASLIKLAKFISGKFNYTNNNEKNSSDLNDDGVLNSDDLLLMIKLLIGDISTDNLQKFTNSINLMANVSSQAVTGKETDDIFVGVIANFSIDLFKNSLSQNENSLVSPTSVMLALSMTANGADGKTLSQMEKVLGSEIPISTLNKYLYSYINDLPSTEKSKLNIANSICYKRGRLAPNLIKELNI